MPENKIYAGISQRIILTMELKKCNAKSMFYSIHLKVENNNNLLISILFNQLT